MKKVRLGIVGLGNMGSAHARSVLGGKLRDCELTAVCDHNPDQLNIFDSVKGFTSSKEMIRSGEIDAILIATPHYDHTTIGIDALQEGLHVLVEKPISVHKADCERLIAAYNKNRKRVFSAMFNQRTDANYRKLRYLIQSGELGEIRRVNWIITSWFRSEAYYASGGWRATWAGEGGGVLLNQCPHNLDLMQWLFGMPVRVRGHCALGKHHKIEVEDEVTAYFEYKNGATGVFITSTGEAPGTNRLEVAAEQGRVVVENGKITYTRNEIPTTEFSRTSQSAFGRPETWNIDVPVRGKGGQHNEILQNFIDAILKGEPLLAPAEEGIHSVELANAILFSSFKDKTIELPLNSRAYETQLKKLIKGSKIKKKTTKPAKAADLSESFA